MNRSWSALWIALILLLTAGFAGAEQAPADLPLMTVYLCSGETRTPAGTAVPLSDMALLASALVLPQNGETLEISDGTHTWIPENVLTDRTGMAAVLLIDEPEPAFPFVSSLVPLNVRVTAEDCAVISEGPDGKRTALRILNGASQVWQDYSCMLVQLSGEAKPGAPLMMETGELAGMILAEYAEGPNRYMMITVDGIVQMLAEISRQADLISEGAPEGFTVTLDANRATIDWKDAEIPKGEGMKAYTVITDTGNSFLTYYPADQELTQVRMLLTPGRTYLAGLVLGADAPDELPEKYAVIAVPEAEPLTEHGFRSILCALTEDPSKDAEAGRTPETLTRITAEQLLSGNVYFYSASSYQVTEQIQETLLVTLTAPDGNNYRYESGWVYGPDYQENDVWYFPLTEGGLLDMMDPGSVPKGQYRMAYYVGGRLADSFTFEVE